MVGAALFYGDAIITPAISVLSAVEGLKVVTPAFDDYVVPITVLILVTLFAAQKLGTARVARVFGPITFVWFIVLGCHGPASGHPPPDVLHALSPLMAVQFLLAHPGVALVVMGAAFLAVTARKRSTPISAISGAGRSCSPGSGWSFPRCSSTISGRAPTCSRIAASSASRSSRW